MYSQAQPQVVFHLGFHEPLSLTVCSLQHHNAMAGTVWSAQCSPRMQEALGSSSNITESRQCFPFFIFILENFLCSCFCMCIQVHLLVHVYVCVWLCVHVCMCKCPWLTSGVFSQCSPSYSLRQGISVEVRVPKTASLLSDPLSTLCALTLVGCYAYLAYAQMMESHTPVL